MTLEQASPLTLRPAVEQLALIQARELSVLELAEAHLVQIERLNPILNALVDGDPERVRAQARALDNASPGPATPLRGLPVTIKSSISVAGHLCETGSLLNQGHRPAQDAPAVIRLRQAGAVILGVTNCAEFLAAYDTENRLYGQTRNPWDTTRTSGGSSGGESAAIAAGLSAAGLGSDSGGSVREPAHFTGICALKPTSGRIPSGGHLPPYAGPFSMIGSLGPMARTIADVDLLFRALSGADCVDSGVIPIPYRPIPEAALRDTVIACFEDDGQVPVTKETREAVQAAAAALRCQGFRVERLTSHTHPALFAALERARLLWWKFFVRGGARLLDLIVQDRGSLLSPILHGFLEIAHIEPPLTGDELLAAWIECDQLRAEMLVHMREYPLLLCPVCSIPAFCHGERTFTIGSEQVAYLDTMRYTQWFNLLGAPAAVIPVGHSQEGLPIGVQVAGRPFDDELVLAVAAILDRDFGFKRHGQNNWNLRTEHSI